MRRTRRLFLLAILVILGSVAVTYHLRRTLQNRDMPSIPKALPQHVNTSGSDWVYAHTVGGKPVVEVRAKNMQQVNEPAQLDLEGVELRIFHKDGQIYDRVESARAAFDVPAGVLSSEGEVEITLAVPADGSPPGRLLTIRSSGVKFDSKTGKAETDQPATFAFDRGDGKAVGASYDPSTRELHMRSRVELNWRGADPNARPMRVEAGELVYKENESRVYLSPWSRLTRNTMTLEGASAVVSLEEGAIRLVETTDARGADLYPNRQIEYGAPQLTMHLSPKSVVEKIVGEGGAELIAISDTARTNVTARRVDLDFDASAGDSVLRKSVATGSARIESKPIPRAGAPAPDTRVLRSEVIQLAMREGGQEIDSVETHAPGNLEFLPNRPGQPKRSMEGDRMWISYAEDNRVKSVRSVAVSTRTENAPKKGGKDPSVSLTWSKDLLAEFDPASSQMRRLEQWGEFRYQEGEQHATADRAVLESPSDRITLTGKGRLWDPSGSTSADRILIDQKEDRLTAEGNVASSRVPDGKDSASGMLSGKEPVQARSRRMVSSDRNRLVIYEGDALLWQGANRLSAERIVIDRTADTLHATGQVVSQLVDTQEEKPKLADGAPKPQNVFTIIRAPELRYTEKDRLAHYQGGVTLKRPGMDVKSRQLRAHLKDGSDSGSGLDRAFADGNVEILQVAEERTKKGSGQHAEYYVAEGKVILHGGLPQLIDSVSGTTRGKQLTYFANNDRLLVDGAEMQPAVSRIRSR